jgi:hypothetical protein
LEGNFIYRNFTFHGDIRYNKKGKKSGSLNPRKNYLQILKTFLLTK